MKKKREYENLIGKKFNKLTVVSLDEERHEHNMRYWWCKCDCGKITKKSISSRALISNNTMSCGLCVTFKDWCIENNRQDVLDRWDYQLNEYNPEEIGYGSTFKQWFKCTRGLHESELHSIGSITSKEYNKISCKKCNSFAQWGIDNLGEDFLDMYWSKENIIDPWNISKGNKNIKILIKCKEKDYHEDYETYSDIFYRNSRCPYCSGRKIHYKDSFAQWGIDNIDKNFIEKYWSDKNTLNPWELTKNNNKKVWIKCINKDYHEYYLTQCSHFYSGKRCPYCATLHGKVHSKDSLGQYIIDNYGQDFLNKVWSDKNKKTPFEYSIGSNQKVWWKCMDDKHEDFMRNIHNSSTYDFRCPKCIHEKRESILQEKVRLYLEKTNYTIVHENNCTLSIINPKTKYKLPYDNEIKELKLLCEVMGNQHYKVTGFHQLQADKNNTIPEQELHYQQLKDRYKRIKAIQQGYYYLEIPYWTDDNDETWKQLIDNKIKEIQENAKLKKVI